MADLQVVKRTESNNSRGLKDQERRCRRQLGGRTVIDRGMDRNKGGGAQRELKTQMSHRGFKLCFKVRVIKTRNDQVGRYGNRLPVHPLFCCIKGPYAWRELTPLRD